MVVKSVWRSMAADVASSAATNGWGSQFLTGAGRDRDPDGSRPRSEIGKVDVTSVVLALRIRVGPRAKTLNVLRQRFEFFLR